MRASLTELEWLLCRVRAVHLPFQNKPPSTKLMEDLVGTSLSVRVLLRVELILVTYEGCPDIRVDRNRTRHLLSVGGYWEPLRRLLPSLEVSAYDTTTKTHTITLNGRDRSKLCLFRDRPPCGFEDR